VHARSHFKPRAKNDVPPGRNATSHKLLRNFVQLAPDQRAYLPAGVAFLAAPPCQIGN